MDERARDLITRVRALAQRRGLTMEQLFDAYDRTGKDGALTRDELTELLKDADVGSWYNRGQYVRGVLEYLDKDSSDSISRDELNAALKDPNAPDAPMGPPLPPGYVPPADAIAPAAAASFTVPIAAVVIVGVGVVLALAAMRDRM
jgi:hypothetical protein